MSASRTIAAPPAERLETQFSDKKPPMTATQALAEANRCLYCFEAPCVKACPTGIEIPEFIRRIASGNLRGSARTILSSNILGFSCARVCPVEVLCEGDCVYNEMGLPPIQIGLLQRHATDAAFEREVTFFEAGEPSGKRVALVGAGPASLACAHELTRLGHEAVIFEAAPYPGGLNTTGVAPYKLLVEDSLREVEYIQQIGFDIQYGRTVGENPTFDDIERDFQAVFLGIGLGGDGWLTLENDRLDGVMGGLQLIDRIKLADGYALPQVGDAVVIGAGNTAMDCVRELLGLGVPNVTLMYRRNAEVMSGYAHEWSAAKEAGARALWWSQPVGYVGDGKLAGVRYVSTRAAADGGPAFDGERVVPADLVALAVGQEKLEALVREIGGVTFERGRILVDVQSGQTTNPKYFSGGDCANGGKEVVNAAAEGKRAAHGIHQYLNA